MKESSANIKSAIVTGATSGIGLAIANMLVDEGYEVYGIGRNFSSEVRFHGITCDLTDVENLKAIVSYIRSKARISMLVNCAGVGVYGLHGQLKQEDIRRLVRTNLEVPMIMTNEFLDDIRENQGWIINISSVTATKVNTHGAAYGATKAGLTSFTHSIFDEYRKHGVKVINIEPDMTDTNLYRDSDFKATGEVDSSLFAEDISGIVKEIINKRDGVVISDITIKPQLHRIEKKTDNK